MRGAMSCLFSSICCLALIPGCAAPVQEIAVLPSAEAVRDRLKTMHPEHMPSQGGCLRFLADTRLTRLDFPVLREHLPQTRFYLTELSTGYFEYPQVKIIVSAQIQSGQLLLHEYFSPDYDEAPPGFLDLFSGLSTKDDRDRRRLGHAFAELLRRTIYKGTLRSERLDDHRYCIELWTAALHWRDIEIVFDDAGILESVTLRNPKGLPADLP